MLVCLCIVYGRFHTVKAELSYSNRDGVVRKSLNYLLLYWDMVLHACRPGTWGEETEE